MNNTQFRMTDITYFIHGDDKYNVYHDDECNCMFVRENNSGGLIISWRWLIRAIWFVFGKYIQSGGIVNQKDDVLVEFESNGTIIHMNITQNGCITKEGSQFLTLMLDPEMNDLVNTILRMPDSDHKNVIKLFTDLMFVNDALINQNQNQNMNDLNHNSKSITPLN